MAMNSLEKVIDSTVFCRFQYQMTAVRLMNMTNPVCDLRVTLLAACDASTNAVMVIGLPCGGGNMCGCGICSSASR